MKKYFYLGFLFFFFFFCLFFYTNALALEVQYPQIGSTNALDVNTELPGYFKYIFDISMGLGILIVVATLAIGGVIWALSSVYPKWKAWASDRISGAITGFFLLLFTYLIITAINPELRIFRLTPLPLVPAPPPPPAQVLAPGVYLYPTADCTGSTFTNYTSTVNDLGGLKFSLKSGKIIQDPANNVYYTMFFHDRPNFQGGCEQLGNNGECTNVITADRPIAKAASMSVYRYNMYDDGDGVKFYRKPFFKEAGGWVRLYPTPGWKLESLSFGGNGGGSGACTVPEEEQDCVKWDINGQCSKESGSRTCPKLTLENINSIDTGGKYIVMFYHDAEVPPPGTNPYKWSNCQIFPTPEDVNFYGPKEMKWDYVRNFGDIPDAVAIFPVVR